jgi:hypothetical protein
MSEDKYLRVIRRIVTPPAFPLIIGPCTANWAKHVAPENPCPDSVETPFRKIVIHTRGAIFLALHFLKRARLDNPLMQVFLADIQRIVDILVWTSPKSIERNSKTMNP